MGIFVANASHLLSALVLYRLGLIVWRSNPQGPLLSLVAALLHVVSPAGLFLSAPYAESTCALLTFLGYLLYASSCTSETAAARDGYVVLAGVAFGFATSFRSNAILNGIPFAWEVLQVLSALAGRWTSSTTSARPSRSDPQSTTPTTGDAVRRLLALGVGGVAVAAGTLVPQAVAYQRFCLGPSDADLPRRPWCDKLVPSIYTFVQRHYWYVDEKLPCPPAREKSRQSTIMTNQSRLTGTMASSATGPCPTSRSSSSPPRSWSSWSSPV